MDRRFKQIRASIARRKADREEDQHDGPAVPVLCNDRGRHCGGRGI